MFECRVRSAHGTGPRARRMQDRESDTGYDTLRSLPDGALAVVSQTTQAVFRSGRFAPFALFNVVLNVVGHRWSSLLKQRQHVESRWIPADYS